MTAPNDETPELPYVGGRFLTPADLLAFLGTVAGAGLADEAACLRSPEGEWWAEVAARWSAVAPLVWAAGGRPYAGDGNQWWPVPASGAQPEVDAAAFNPDGWPEVDLAAMIAAIPLSQARPTPAAALEAMVPPALGRWVLRRAAALGLQVFLKPAIRRPLLAEGDETADSETGVLLIRLETQRTRGRRAKIPQALVRALGDLPFTVLGRRVASPDEGGALLVDVQRRLPLAASLVSGMVPSGETWVLGGPDVGAWRLEGVGEAVDGADLLQMPEMAVADLPAGDHDVRLPAPIPVRVVPRAGGPARVDGILLDASELVWVRHFLAGRPAGEKAFLMLGGTRALLVAPGGLPGTLPFGVPLERVGPGGIFLELGLELTPPLPIGARRKVFALDDGQAMAVVGEGAFRFTTECLVPAWSLWVGAGTEVKNSLASTSRRLLEAVSVAIRQMEAADLAADGHDGHRLDPDAVPRLRREALEAELNGDLVGAAELLQQAGDLGEAGRLYERAAAQV